MNISFPTDTDGFLSRECPSCEQRFKVVFGQGSEEPISYCPYCGYNGQECWHTRPQVDYMQAVAADIALGPELKKLERQLKGMSNGLIEIELKSSLPKPPPAPMETDDPLETLRFPCCNETIKVTRHNQHFCIICGTEIDMEISDSKKVFLSHKGIDKDLVIDFQETLKILGYKPWLDEDAMPAGTALERGLLQGMRDSCGVVFFITPSFKDKGFLQTEIDYAIQQKREKDDKFAIVILQFAEDGEVGEIPGLLTPYVWKKPKSRLEALREIVRALPVAPGTVDWRDGITGVAATPKTKSISTELSDEAKKILKAAATDNGSVQYIRTLDGEWILAGRDTMLPGGAESRIIARWRGGLEDLQRRRFIEDRGHKGEVFRVTREGYEAVDELPDV
uniref:TIR domain-containing protein n=1 Tax=Candidatus Kentrum sp. TC TaxID=2126339 RepID=A0A450YM31_9GAMM|nr:MAG: TIR domain-containing protein [Candidatus Kentron sp. TC]